MFTLPSNIQTDYNNFVDELMTNSLSSNEVTLYYPVLKTVCTSCESDRPSSFTTNECVQCGGSGYIESITTATIRLRIHYNAHKIWSKLNSSIEIAEGSLVCYGYLSDIDKIMSCEYALMYSDISSSHQWKYKLASDPLPHGFGRNRYFVSLWEKL